MASANTDLLKPNLLVQPMIHSCTDKRPSLQGGGETEKV